MKILNMKSHLFSIVLLIGGFASAQTDSIRKLPAIYPNRTAKIDVAHQSIDFRFDWKKKQAIGSTSLTLSVLQATDHIALDAGMLTIDKITLDQKPL